MFLPYWIMESQMDKTVFALLHSPFPSLNAPADNDPRTRVHLYLLYGLFLSVRFKNPSVPSFGFFYSFASAANHALLFIIEKERERGGGGEDILALKHVSRIFGHCNDPALPFCPVCGRGLSSCSVLKYWLGNEKQELLGCCYVQKFY